MTNKLSEKEIEAIRKRAEKATEGWIAVDGVYVVSRDDDGNDIVIAECDTEDNAYFIGEARQDITKLLAEIERSRELLVKAYQYGISSEAYQKDGDIKEIREYIYGGDDE